MFENVLDEYIYTPDALCTGFKIKIGRVMKISLKELCNYCKCEIVEGFDGSVSAVYCSR